MVVAQGDGSVTTAAGLLWRRSIMRMRTGTHFQGSLPPFRLRGKHIVACPSQHIVKLAPPEGARRPGEDDAERHR
jgi:hypothetical protein